MPGKGSKSAAKQACQKAERAPQKFFEKGAFSPDFPYLCARKFFKLWHLI
jgi:hypothetical protein